MLGKLIKHAVKLPINIVKDVVTMGGVLEDDEPALKKQLREFEEDMDNSKI